MERVVKATVCLVDGMGSGHVGWSRWERVVGCWVVVGACYGVVAGPLSGWGDAPGRYGSADRHTDIRGLGPHVGDTQEGAPD
jgi:hypothetical protein